jgi:hypothetical protein
MTEDNREERGERVVACPVKDCDATPLARGVNLHILRSSGGGHGEQGDFPDSVSLDDLEETGRKEVSVNYPDERESESKARLCPYCRQHFSGKSGVQIHLGQMSGRRNHPPEASALHDPEDFPVVELDENENITSVVKNPTADSDSDRENSGEEGAAKKRSPRSAGRRWTTSTKPLARLAWKMSELRWCFSVPTSTLSTATANSPSQF